MKNKIILFVMLLLLGVSNSIAQYGTVVSFTYDDGYPSWYDVGFPIFQEYGFPGVAYINATNSWVSSPGYDAVNKLHEMQTAGWEISSHTYDHSGVTDSSVGLMKAWLDSHGFPNSGFCAPGHAWNHSMVNIVKKYHPYYSATYLNPTQVGMLTQPLDLYYMKRFPLDNSVTIEQVEAVLNDAVLNDRWVIFYGHPLGNTPGGWEQSDSLLRATFDKVMERGIPVKTVREVINDLFPPGCVIECSVDTLQSPVLTTFEEDSLGGGAFNTSVWNEYWHITNYTEPRYIGSPVVYCHTSNDSLPVMKFFRDVPDGEYEVIASIIERDAGRTYRLYYSFDSLNTSQYNVEVSQTSDISLGTVTITNGQFALYTQKADVVSGDDGYVGWAFIKLIAKPLLLDLKVFLEGPYNGSGLMTTTLKTQGLIPKYQPYKLSPWNYKGTESAATFSTDVVDWVIIELRSDLTTTISKRAGLLLNNGSIVDIDGSGPVKFKDISDGNYYVVVRHRNHLAIMTASPITLSKGSIASYNFTTSQSQAYSTGNDPMVTLSDESFGMIAGDANNSSIITAADVTPIITNLNNSDYNGADINMSGIVTAADVTKIISNLNKTSDVP